MRTSGTSTPRIRNFSRAQAQPVVLPAGLPALEVDHELDALRDPDRGDPVEVLDVDDPEAAELHVVAGEVGEEPSRVRPCA
jgi:hypothetical protein